MVALLVLDPRECSMMLGKFAADESQFRVVSQELVETRNRSLDHRAGIVQFPGVPESFPSSCKTRLDAIASGP